MAATRTFDPPASVVCGGEVDAATRPVGVADILLAASGRTDRGLLVSGDAGRPAFVSYALLHERASIIAGGLVARGLAGQRVVLVGDSSHEILYALWGSVLARAAPLPAAPTENASALRRKRLVETIEAVKPAALLASARHREFLLSLGGASFDVITLDALLEGEKPTAMTAMGEPPSLDEDALLLRTSGTTGSGNIVRITHRNLFWAVRGAIEAAGFDSKDRSLNWLGLSQISGIARTIRDTLLQCMQVHVPTAPILLDPLRWLDSIEEHGATSTWAPNFAFERLADALEHRANDRRWDLTHVRSLLSSGEPISAKTMARLGELLARHGLRSSALQSTWGMTETCASSTFSDRVCVPTALDGRLLADCGTPVRGISLRVVTAEGAIVPEGTVGALEVSGPAVTPGYLEDDPSLFSEDGWLKTGDLAVLQEGRLAILGREKAVVVINGAKYGAAELETALAGLPGVEPASVTVFESSREAAGAGLVVVYSPTLETDESETASAIAERLARRVGVVPRHVVGVLSSEMPRTAGGKIARGELRRRFDDGTLASARRDRSAAQPTRPGPLGGAAGDTGATMHAVGAATLGSSAAAEAEQHLREALRTVLGAAAADVAHGQSVFSLGVGSVEVMQLVEALRTRLPSTTLVAGDVFRYPRFGDLAAHLSREPRESIASSESASSGDSNDRRATGARMRRAEPAREPGVAPDDIAVVGMSVRFPGARSVAEFWENLKGGIESVTTFDEAELRAAGVSSHALSSPNYVRANAILDDIESFDAAFFDITPREAESMDPQHRLFLECATHALDSAGYRRDGSRRSVGVFAGARISEYFLSHQRPLDMGGLERGAGSPVADLQVHLGNDKDFLATRVSHRLDLRGPSLTVQTACSTSLVAVHLASQALRQRECDLALAGGVCLRVPQKAGYFIADGLVFSPDGHTRPFDHRAAGTIFSSGVGAVVLKRLSEAIEDGDLIYAVIKGSAVNNDGSNKASYTAPSTDAQIALLREAHRRSGVSADSIGYVEAHGTGTAIGDPMEVAALAEVFGGLPTASCALGSVKSNVGHLTQAAGVAGLIKAALMLHEGMLVPTVNFEKPNADIDFAKTPFYVCTATAPWAKREGTPRRAGVSSFGFGGTNCHVILEEAPLRSSRPRADHGFHALCLSANEDETLREVARLHAARLRSGMQEQLDDICFTANARRTRLRHRVGVVGESREELLASLDALSVGQPDANVRRREPGEHERPPRIGFLFTGQGAQWAGMGRSLYEKQPVFRESLARCAHAIRDLVEPPLLDVMIGDDPAKTTLLPRATYTQPAIVALELALAALLRAWGVIPHAVLGHSLGEIAAASHAGLFDIEDAMRFAAHRGRLMDALQAKGLMAAIFADEDEVAKAVAERAATVAIAAVNGPNHLVISGDATDVSAIAARFEARGVRAVTLDVSHAFHSPHMDPILDELEAHAAALGLRPTTIPVVPACASRALDDTRYWRVQARSPVLFHRGVQTLLDGGVDAFVEIGPRPVLANMVRRIARAEQSLVLTTLNGPPGAHREARDIAETIARLDVRGVPVDWRAIHGPSARVVPLPSYPFRRQRHWMDAPRREARPSASSTGHPLLERRLDVADPTFEGALREERLSYLYEHRVGGRAILAGAAFVEMMLAGAQAVPELASSTVTDVELLAPLPLSDGGVRQVQIGFSAAAPRPNPVAIHSRVEGSGTWTLHARARLSASLPAPRVDALETLRARIGTTVDVGDHYERLRARGLDYGPRCRILRSLCIGDREALGEIDVSALDPAAYVLHPALLDGCFHVVTAIRAQETHAFAPIAVERISVAKTAPARVFCHARIRASDTERTRISDFSLYDERGEVVATLEGCVSVRVDDGLGSAAERPSEAKLIHRVVWRTEPLSASRPSTPERERAAAAWWAIGGPRELAELCREELGRAGVECAIADERPTTRDDFAAVLDRLHHGTPDPEGILYLGALDGSAEATEHGKRLLGLVQAILARPLSAGPRPSLVVATRGAQDVDESPLDVDQAALWGLTAVFARECTEWGAALVDLDPSATDRAAASSLAAEIRGGPRALRVAFRRSERYVARLVTHEPTDPDAVDGGEPLAMGAPGRGEIEIAVSATGVNFKDVLVRLGAYPGSDPQEPSSKTLGIEVCGRVTRRGEGVVDVSEGDVVVALTGAGLASRVITDARVAVPLPPSISRAEGAGLPVAFLTAHYALRAIARLAADQRVLIHAATGGVGLAAVHLARRIGAQVYATAGSERKRAHLRAMGVEHVFDSRSTSFGADVLRATDSAGVNLVLNSLSGEFIATGLSVVSRDGVFVEIGKRGIWSSQEVAAVRPDVRYEIFDLAAFRRENPEAVGRALRAIVGEVERGELPALPITVFAASAADDAFRFMQQARQIGKVVVAQPLPAQLDAAATYLISGGFGALGLASARWLVEHGARHLVLFSRSGPDAAAREKIQALERLGAVVIARRGDVSKREDVASIIDLVRGTLPPLRGVIHTAGILDDGLMVDENADRFERVMAPKVAGARHLDALTRALPLDFFVLFSSGSWLLGTPGQGAYAAANAYLDVLARERRRRGLPATTVNWGAWRGDGMAATLDAQSRERRAKLGYGEIAPSTALDVLGRLLRTGETSAAVLPMDWPRFVSSLRDDQRDFFEELVTRAPAMAAEETAPSELARRVREAPSNARAAMVEDALAHTLRRVLGFRDARSLSPERPLRELGLDSLMAMEFTARLREVTSLRLSPTVTFNHPNLRDLAEHVIERLVDSEPSTPETRDDALEGPADADAAALEDRIARLERLLDADL